MAPLRRMVPYVLGQLRRLTTSSASTTASPAAAAASSSSSTPSSSPASIKAHDGPTEHLSLSEFSAALRPLLEQRPRRRNAKIGIAVSGGVDSMALARLCQALAAEQPEQGLSFHALIVNHHARPEAGEEAVEVSKQLEKFGLQSTIIDAAWSAGASPSSTTKAFETLGRNARYRALGVACRDMDMPELLVAHHADDMAENVLLRLLYSGGGAGLPGMYPRRPIIEHTGVYGVSGSGAPQQMPTVSNSGSGGGGGRGNRPDDTQRPPMLRMEGGGIDVLRPLLHFSKARLAATCARYGVRWFEDASNADVRLTPRNAVRRLLRDDRLPRPLSLPALVALARRCMDYRLCVKAEAHALLHRCDVLFDTRVGSVMIRLPRRIHPNNDGDDNGGGRVNDDGSKINGVRVLDVALEFVRLVAIQVSPKAPGQSKVLINHLLCLFPYLRSHLASSSSKEENEKGMVVEEIGGTEEQDEDMLVEEGESEEEGEEEEAEEEEMAVQEIEGRKEHKKKKPQRQRQQATSGTQVVKAPAMPTTSFQVRRAVFTRVCYRDALSAKHHAELDANFVWYVSRQPEARILPLEFAPRPPPGPSSSSPSSLWSPWQLWDGRFWVRVANRSAATVRLQQLGPQNTAHLHRQLRRQLAARLSPYQRRQQLASIEALAPLTVRQTLPALVLAVPPPAAAEAAAAATAAATAEGTAVAEAGKGKRAGKQARKRASAEVESVLALPSLSIPRSQSVLGGKVQWEIRYKETCFAYYSSSET